MAQRRKERWLTVAEAAEILGVRRGSVYARINKGTIPVRKVGGLMMVKAIPTQPRTPRPPKPPRPEADPEATLTAADVAAMLGVSVGMVREQVAAGRLRSSRKGSAFRFRPQDVDAYLEAGRIKPGRKPPV